jgi:hypothetical protein
MSRARGNEAMSLSCTRSDESLGRDIDDRIVLKNPTQQNCAFQSSSTQFRHEQ